MRFVSALAAGLAVASLAFPALAQTAPTPTHTAAQTTITDTVTADTDARGKTKVKHHRVVRRHWRSVPKSEDMANKSAQ